MANYVFAPHPKSEEVNLVNWADAFSIEELDKISAYCDTLTLGTAITSGATPETQDTSIRKSKTAWVGYNEDSALLYDRLAYVCRMLNSKFFNFDLSGFHEDFQYTVYDGTEDHYTWHMDKGMPRGVPQRKLSMVLQLSDPWEYEGGELEIMDRSEPVQVKKEKGIIFAFPSYIMHRVTPVTSGVRKTLVVWSGGPQFK